MMANKLSRDADQWFNNFNKFQSNQGRKVWTIVDINKLKSMRDDWFFVYNGTDQQNVPVEQFWTNFNNKVRYYNIATCYFFKKLMRHFNKTRDYI